MTEKLDLSLNLDEDIALEKSRKYLILTSLVLMALVFSGASVTEANTFLFKLEFTNSNGIKDLLMLSIAFLLVRYYSNASKYHDAIYNTWTARLRGHDFFYHMCEHSNDETGYLVDLAPDYFKCNDPSLRYYDQSETPVSCFHINLLINTQIQYDFYTSDGHVRYDRVYLIQRKHIFKSLKAIALVLKFWLEAQYKYRESLEIYSPYFISFFAIGLSIANKNIINI